MTPQLFNYLLRITSCSIICLIYFFYNHKKSKEYQETIDNLKDQSEIIEKERIQLLHENERLLHENERLIISQTNKGILPHDAIKLHKFQEQPSYRCKNLINNEISDLKTAINKATTDLKTAAQTAWLMTSLGGNDSLYEYNSKWGLK